jgi:ATP/ADP translocase
MDLKQITTISNKIKLKKEGVAALQVFFIFILASLEYIIRHGFGIVTGVILLAMVVLGNRFGREGAAYAAVVTPPIAFAATALFWSILSNNIHIAKLLVDFIGSLASAGPWLILGAAFGWYTFLHQRAQKKISDARRRA